MKAIPVDSFFFNILVKFISSYILIESDIGPYFVVSTINANVKFSCINLGFTY